MDEPKEDQFPLSPYYPINRDIDGRTVSFALESGGIWIRSKGDSLRQFDLTGTCSADEHVQFLAFYDSHKINGCTLVDRGVDPVGYYWVKFTSAPKFAEIGYQTFSWEITAKEQPDA